MRIIDIMTYLCQNAIMQLVRTTIRLTPQLKKTADLKAFRSNTTFQSLVEKALDNYLNQESRHHAQKLVFKDKNIGVPLDQLSREDIYVD